MRFRIRTIQVLIVLSAAPIWTLCEGAKAGSVVPVLVVWVVLVAVPLVLMYLAERRVKHETARDWAIILLAGIAVMGYSAAIPISFFVMAMHSLRGIR